MEERIEPKKAEAIESKKQLEWLDDILENNLKAKLRAVAETIKRLESCEEINSPKAGVLPRLRFQRLGASFFIDFVVAPKEAGDELAIEGRMVYGACRPTAEENDKKCKLLFECPVSRNGLIKNPGVIQGQWMADKPRDVADLHYLVMVRILKDALNWVNEYPSD